MSYKLNSSEEMLLQMVKTFSEKEVLPLDMKIDKDGKYPKELWEKVINTGFLNLIIPFEYDGAGFSPLAEALTIYYIAKSNASLAFTLEGHYKTVNQLIKYGSDNLKNIYLKQKDKRIFGFGSTEPQGGSNVTGNTTTAIKDNDGNYILNVNKSMITNGGLAEVYLVLAKTSDDLISCFLVDEKNERI